MCSSPQEAPCSGYAFDGIYVDRVGLDSHLQSAATTYPIDLYCWSGYPEWTYVGIYITAAHITMHHLGWVSPAKCPPFMSIFSLTSFCQTLWSLTFAVAASSSPATHSHSANSHPSTPPSSETSDCFQPSSTLGYSLSISCFCHTSSTSKPPFMSYQSCNLSTHALDPQAALQAPLQVKEVIVEVLLKCRGAAGAYIHMYSLAGFKCHLC